MKKLFVFLIALALANMLSANNIVVSNLSLTGKNTTDDYIQIQFDLSWENSWRAASAPNNWDAAWVFVKYRASKNEAWQHAWLNSAGQVAPSGSTIEIGRLNPKSPFNATTNPGIGAFIYSDAGALGTFNKSGVQLRWNYGTNGVADAAPFEIQVFAIEMVYVPVGAFSLGSGGAEAGAFYKSPTATDTYQVSAETAITVGTAANNLYYGSAGGDHSGPIPLAFPKGHKPFYCMKYEISQQQYVGFLNTLTRGQQNARTLTNLQDGTTFVTARYVMSRSSGVNARNGIRCDAVIDATAPVNFYCDVNGNGIGNEPTDGQSIACNYLSWADLAAYLDWSGLRPMTELEFEKACRGTLAAVPNEYAWGTTGIAGSRYSGTNQGAENEEVTANYSTSAGNANTVNTNILNGPFRVGIFAGTAGNTGRVTAGATFYGIMEMSGNVWERAISVGSPAGRSYTGTHGNGVLSSDGYANALSWPGIDAAGVGGRGADWTVPETLLRISDRIFSSQIDAERMESYGGRGVRLMP